MFSRGLLHSTAGNIKNDECQNYLIELNEINILTAGQHDW